MITSVKIQNFRSFKDFEMEAFSRINLFVGDNSIGKTTVMEAIACLASGCNLKNYQTITANRSLYQPTVENDLPYRSFFHKFDFKNDISITATSKLGDYRVVIQGNKLPQVPLSDPTQKHFTSNSPRLDQLSVFYQSPQSAEWQVQTWEASQQYAPIDSCRNALGACWLQPGPLNLSKMALELGQVQMDTQKKNQFLHLIQAVNPEISDYSYIPATHEMGYISLKMKDGVWMPLQLLGSGYLWMIYLLYQCVYSGATIVCVDEIDTGLHRSAMVKFWKALLGYVHENQDIQLFATTHSEEFIEATLEVFEKSPKDIACFRFVRNVRDGAVDYINSHYNNLNSLHALDSSFT